MNTPSRPVLRWHGGKWRLAPWIIGHFPAHRVYVEPFGGAASVLLRKPRSQSEVYNDLDGDVVNLFRVLRGPRAAELVETLRLTPFARSEFLSAYEFAEDEVERARRLIVRSFMGFGSNAAHRLSGFRGNGIRAGTLPQHNWAAYPEALGAVIDRLSAVVVESRDAIELMHQQDRVDTLHYVDPPYILSTRGDGGADYAHEFEDDDHRRLLDALRDLRGMVVISGYPHPLYDEALSDWRRVARTAMADGARQRTEVLWINPVAARALDARERERSGSIGLFGVLPAPSVSAERGA